MHRTERDHKAAVMFQKVKVLPFPPNSPEMEFSKCLASYASQFVLQEFKLMDKSMKTMKSFKVQTSEGQKKVSLLDGSVPFADQRLFCRHMFALRKILQHSLFEADICDKRWTSAYYRATQRLFSISSSQPVLVSTVS